MSEAPANPSGNAREIVDQFTKQVDTFVKSPHVNAEEPVRRFLALVRPRGDERALDVACGPGLLAKALAPVVGSFVGVDLTSAMIDKARLIAGEAKLSNARFEVADATALPFADGSFDLAVTRLALHHMADPARSLAEMTRVLAPGGHLAVFDIEASEIPAEAIAQNEIERLRDPSHTRALSLSELVQLLGGLRLELDRIETFGFRIAVEDWINRAFQTPEARAEVHRRLAQPGPRAFGGRKLYRDADGLLCFETRYMVVVAARPG
jgi:ubiquinone/menaquinone biosynthesis C-methylase UbiE